MALDASSHWMIPSLGWAGFPDQETRLSACTSSTWQASTTSGVESAPVSWTRPGQQLFWNVDPPRGHTALQNNLYASIPFTLVLSENQAWGVFLDSTTRVEFDLAHDDPQRAWFGAGSGDLVYYVFCGPTPKDVLARYTDLTGHKPH